MKANILQRTSHGIKRNLLISFMTLVIAILTNVYEVNGQDVLDITAGAGFPQLLNAGVRAHIKQAQIGFTMGSFPVSDESLLTLSGDVSYHFAGHSSFSDLHPWYGKVSLNYIKDENVKMKDAMTFIGPWIGRDINVNRRLGISLEGGFIFLIDEQHIDKVPVEHSGWELNLDTPPILPCIQLTIFYQL